MVKCELLTLDEAQERADRSMSDYFWEQVANRREEDKVRTISEIKYKLREWGYTNFKVEGRCPSRAFTVEITVKSFKRFKAHHFNYIRSNKLIQVRFVLIRKMPILGIELERHIF